MRAFKRIALVFVILGLYWGYRSGHLLWTGSGLRLAGHHVPGQAPTAEVHPEVLNLQASFSKVAELVKPAVVSISTIRTEQVPEMQQFYFGDPFEQFFDPYGDPRRRMPQHPSPRKFRMEGMGSGVVIDAEGLVLTNEHVVRDADEIKVLLYDKDNKKSEFTGKVVGKDARTDLAVVRIRAGHKLPYAALGDSDKVRVGDWAIAIGSPFGLAQTVTVGVISADRQSLAIENKEYRNMIQTDAAINRGNSGGPLLNIHGEIVGINTAIYAPTGVFAGVGFAVPINQAKLILDDLVNRGHVVRGWLGVELSRDISPEMVKSFGLKNDKGALVSSVLPDSPAEKAGLKRGDVILSYDGKAVESSDKLQTFVSQTAPKKSVRLEVFRAHKSIELPLVIGERPEAADLEKMGGYPSSKKESKGKQKTWLGAHVLPLTAELAENFRQPAEAQGVVVTEVDVGSDAEEVGLIPGDIIRAINQEPTPDVAAFARASSRAKLSEGIVLDILRQGRPLYLSYTKQ